MSVLREDGIGPMANLTTGGNGKQGHFFCLGFYSLINLVTLHLHVPGTEFPASIALKVPEPHKSHHSTGQSDVLTVKQ